jgi:ABC-type nitrate/sulfonate/bicarbonate transport system ATPase subunit
MAMAFQQPGLFPWMTVRRNVSIGLRTRGHSRREAAERTAAVLDMVGLAEFKESYPSQLSGGMAQRVGIARALVLKPRLLLLDEPFAAVDAFTRLTLQEEFKSLLTLDRPTVMFVTHDVSEAIMLGDYVVVMSNRPATVKAEFTITSDMKNRSSPEYSEMLSKILEKLGIKSGKSRE